ncbi:MAG: hypothetical protein P8X96_02320 [Desulfobacteraceae bacterium]
MDDWNQYRQDTGWDLNSPDPAAPLFINAAVGNFRLHPASPAHNAGIAVAGRLTDFYGNLIVGTPEIGAVEIQE